VLDDVQRSWAQTFSHSDERYPKADLVLFTQSTNSACGGATSAIGPHYCPADQKVYLDLDFFRELRDQFGAPGDFAQAYVLAHEIGHHVQNVLGINEQVQRAQQSGSDDANELSVLLELQADCLAGVWGYTTRDRGILEPGDLQEGLRAAASVGDDRIQAQAGQRVNPETWTHGSSEQRVDWFQRGFESGDPSRCDTFGD
jgi:predicted metalloprotease